MVLIVSIRYLLTYKKWQFRPCVFSDFENFGFGWRSGCENEAWQFEKNAGKVWGIRKSK